MITLSNLKKITKGAKANELFNYLNHKQTGGANNAKGNLFESFFTTFKIAQFWEQDPLNTIFTSQELCFIDDLVIGLNSKGVYHYQIKDIQYTSWKRGKNNLANDFSFQRKYNYCLGIKSKLYLVVSNKSLAKRLRISRPKKLIKIVTVKHFPATTSVNRLILESPTFRKALSELCALKNPQTDKLETIAAQILGQWDISGKTRVTLGQIRDRCLTSSPHFFKGGGNHISNRLDALLRSVNDLTFTISNGTLEWDFNSGTDNGVLPYKIGSTEFNQFENDLLNFPIGVTFQEIEHLFI